MTPTGVRERDGHVWLGSIGTSHARDLPDPCPPKASFSSTAARRWGVELGCSVSIKLETANPVRCFKARGTELVASMLTDQGRTAAVCASAGNLGQALGWSGRRRGLDVTVVASRRATRCQA